MSGHSVPRLERRRHLRIPLKVEVRSGQRFDPQWAINLSRAGMGLQSRRPHKPGEKLRMRFRLAPDAPRVEVDAEVVWCAEEAELLPRMRYYELGLRFVHLDKATQEMIQRFVDASDFLRQEEEGSGKR